MKRKLIILTMMLIALSMSSSNALPTKSIMNPYTGTLQLITNTSMLGNSALAFSTCLDNQSSTWNGTFLNCISPIDNSKVNKSGDIMSNVTISQNTRANFTVAPPLNRVNAIISNTGVQALLVGNATSFWNGNHVVEIIGTNQLDADYGLSATPLVVSGGSGAIEFWKSSNSDAVIAFGMAVPGTPLTNDFVVSGFTPQSGWKRLLLINSTTKEALFDGLSGSGKAIVQVDSTGKLYANHSAGSGITMKSPDGNSWCVSINNGGSLITALGACP